MRVLTRTFFILFILAMLVYVSIILFVCHLEATIPPPGDYEAIVILGAQVKENGEPSLQLAYRLEKALEVYLQNPCLIITSGAQGSDEPMPEADFMRWWLVSKGVPESNVIADNQSLNTRQNIKNASVILRERSIQNILIITSDYHLPRSMAIANDEGFTVSGVGSLCKNDIVNWSRNHMREAIAWCKYWVEKYTGIQLS